jgi:hypothetical protein
MNTPSTPELDSWSAPPTYRDRGTGLTIFGVMQILAGALCALMVPVMLLGFVMSKKVSGVSTPMGSELIVITQYSIMAILLIVLGIGSVQAKRWAYGLSLILSYVWLIGGILGTVAITAIMPVAIKTGLRQAPGGQEPHTALMAVILTIVIGFLAIFLIVLPIVFLNFYSKKDVWETCRHRDPVERWTERVPLPVLAASLFFFASACMSLVSTLGARLFPFFGTYLVGIPAAIVLVVIAAVDFYLAGAFYKLQGPSWYLALAIRALLILSAAITTLRNDLMNAYVKLGMSSQELRVLNSNPITHSKAFLWFGLAYSLVFLGYLIWLKKYFNNSTVPQTAILASE